MRYQKGIVIKNPMCDNRYIWLTDIVYYISRHRKQYYTQTYLLHNITSKFNNRNKIFYRNIQNIMVLDIMYNGSIIYDKP